MNDEQMDFMVESIDADTWGQDMVDKAWSTNENDALYIVFSNGDEYRLDVVLIKKGEDGGK